MKKNYLLLIAGCVVSLNMLGVPANPKWLQQLKEEGDYAKLEQVMHRSERKANLRHAAREMGVSGIAATPRPLNLAPKGLIILVNFSDLSWTTADHAEMDSMINGQNYTRNYSYTYYGQRYNVRASGSAKKYFHDVSAGQYNPEFTVVGPVTISRPYSYYGQNDSGGEDMHAEEMIVEACRLADSQGVDFTQFDHNGDGDIDFVYVFYAGAQESDGSGDDYIWPHSYALEDYYYLSTRQGGLGNSAVMLDGKRLNKYACSGEIESYSGQHDGIGTFCHEFSHVLGLPDHYATDYSTQKTLGQWDILDAGPYNNEGNTPPHYSAYEQFFMGWLTPTVLSDTGTYQLRPLEEERQAYLICAGGTHNLIGNDPNPSTFYILENRQQTGWDTYLPGHGLMITKIQYDYNKWLNNVVNNTASAMGVDLIEADGLAPVADEMNPDNGYYGKATDLFPAGANQYNRISGYPISNIREENGIVTFTIGGSGSTIGNCSDYAWTATKKLSGGEEQLDDYSWTITAPSGTYFGYEGSGSARGAQFGSKSAPVQSLVMSTNEVANCLISSVVINAAQAKDGDSRLSVFIGNTQIGATESLTQASANYTFTNSANLTGELRISISNTKKAVYIKSINITQSSAPQTGLEQTECVNQTQKVLENGQIILIRDGVRYDILGRRMN